MKNIQTLILLLLLASSSFAQSLSPRVTATAGGRATGGDVSLSYTTGETFNTKLSANNQQLTQGQQQPEIDLRLDISQATVCAGATLSVPFSAAGYVDASNVFTVQISDANGSFANPRTIGSVTSMVSGSIVATVPATLIAGSGYKARMVSSKPERTTSDVLNVTVKSNSSSISNITVCASKLPFNWNGGIYTSSGVYTYTTTNAAGCDSLAKLNLSVTSTTPTVSPAITQTLVSNLCGARKYRFSAATTSNATGFNWVLPTSVGGVSGVTLDSGDATYSRVIVLTFASNAAAITGDCIKVRAYSDCGFTAYEAAKLSNAALTVPAAATAITITPLQTNICSSRKYRYSAPNLPAATTTTVATTGYVWNFVGTLASTMTIDSGNLNSQRFTVTFTSNAASAPGDSVRMYYTSGCGNSLTKAAKLTNTSLVAPATTVTITPIQTTICSARKYRYSAPNLPLATTTTGAASGYVWDVIGSLATTMTIDSGDLYSQRFTVTFTSNAAAATGDSVRVLYTTAGCGNSARKSAKLANTLLAAPAAPASITIATKSDVFNARTYRYIAPAPLPGSTTSTGAASGYLWSTPTGTVGATGVIDSGNVNSRIITVTYSSNAAAGKGDSIRLRYTSAGCGNGAIKAQKLSNLIKVGCTPIAKNTSIIRIPNSLPTSMEVKVYPNPTTTQFNVQVKSSGTEEAVVRVLDLTGRFIKRVKVSSISSVNLGSDLKAGAYMLEVRQGKEVKMIRVMKF